MAANMSSATKAVARPSRGCFLFQLVFALLAMGLAVLVLPTAICGALGAQAAEVGSTQAAEPNGHDEIAGGWGKDEEIGAACTALQGETTYQ